MFADRWHRMNRRIRRGVVDSLVPSSRSRTCALAKNSTFVVGRETSRSLSLTNSSRDTKERRDTVVETDATSSKNIARLFPSFPLRARLRLPPLPLPSYTLFVRALSFLLVLPFAILLLLLLFFLLLLLFLLVPPAELCCAWWPVATLLNYICPQ